MNKTLLLIFVFFKSVIVYPYSAFSRGYWYWRHAASTLGKLGNFLVLLWETVFYPALKKTRLPAQINSPLPRTLDFNFSLIGSKRTPTSDIQTTPQWLLNIWLIDLRSCINSRRFYSLRISSVVRKFFCFRNSPQYVIWSLCFWAFCVKTEWIRSVHSDEQRAEITADFCDPKSTTVALIGTYKLLGFGYHSTFSFFGTFGIEGNISNKEYLQNRQNQFESIFFERSK